MRILIVEDDVLNTKLFRRLLQLEGFETLAAGTAEAGIALAIKAQPDCILMDIQLPGMDGLEATRRLRGLPKTADIPIIALAAHAMVGDDHLTYEAGCRGYISKPVDPRTFADSIGKFIAGATKRNG